MPLLAACSSLMLEGGGGGGIRAAQANSFTTFLCTRPAPGGVYPTTIINSAITFTLLVNVNCYDAAATAQNT